MNEYIEICDVANGSCDRLSSEPLQNTADIGEHISKIYQGKFKTSHKVVILCNNAKGGNNDFYSVAKQSSSGNIMGLFPLFVFNNKYFVNKNYEAIKEFKAVSVDLNVGTSISEIVNNVTKIKNDCEKCLSQIHMQLQGLEATFTSCDFFIGHARKYQKKLKVPLTIKDQAMKGFGDDMCRSVLELESHVGFQLLPNTLLQENITQLLRSTQEQILQYIKKFPEIPRVDELLNTYQGREQQEFVSICDKNREFENRFSSEILELYAMIEESVGNGSDNVLVLSESIDNVVQFANSLFEFKDEVNLQVYRSVQQAFLWQHELSTLQRSLQKSHKDKLDDCTNLSNSLKKMPQMENIVTLLIEMVCRCGLDKVRAVQNASKTEKYLCERFEKSSMFIKKTFSSADSQFRCNEDVINCLENLKQLSLFRDEFALIDRTIDLIKMGSTQQSMMASGSFVEIPHLSNPPSDSGSFMMQTDVIADGIATRTNYDEGTPFSVSTTLDNRLSENDFSLSDFDSTTNSQTISSQNEKSIIHESKEEDCPNAALETFKDQVDTLTEENLTLLKANKALECQLEEAIKEEAIRSDLLAETQTGLEIKNKEFEELTNSQKSRIEQLENELAAFKQHGIELETELEKEKQNSQQALESYKEESDKKYRTHVALSEAFVKETEVAMETLRSEHTTELTKRDCLLADLQNQNAQLTASNDDLKMNCVSLEKSEKDKLMDLTVKLKEQEEQSQLDLEAVQFEKATLEKELESVLLELDQIKQASGIATLKFNEHLSELEQIKAQHRSLEKEYEMTSKGTKGKEEELEKLKENLRALEEEKETSNQKINDVVAELDQLKELHGRSMDEEREKFVLELNEVKQALEKFENECLSLKEESEKSNQMMKEKEEEVKKIKEEGLSWKEESEKLTQKMNKKVEEHDQLKENCLISEEERETSIKKANELEKEVNELEQERDQLKEQRCSILLELDDLKEQYRALQDKNEESVNKINERELELKEMKEELEKDENDETSESEFHDAQHDEDTLLEAAELRIATVESQLDELKKHNQLLEGERMQSSKLIEETIGEISIALGLMGEALKVKVEPLTLSSDNVVQSLATTCGLDLRKTMEIILSKIYEVNDLTDVTAPKISFTNIKCNDTVLFLFIAKEHHWKVFTQSTKAENFYLSQDSVDQHKLPKNMQLWVGTIVEIESFKAKPNNEYNLPVDTEYNVVNAETKKYSRKVRRGSRGNNRR